MAWTGSKVILRINYCWKSEINSSKKKKEKKKEEETWLKFLTPNKLLTRLPMLIAQRKAGNNSCN